MTNSVTNQRPTPVKSSEAYAIGEPEPWASWETRLCLWSLVLGIGGLIILAIVLHTFLL